MVGGVGKAGAIQDIATSVDLAVCGAQLGVDLDSLFGEENASLGQVQVCVWSSTQCREHLVGHNDLAQGQGACNPALHAL